MLSEFLKYFTDLSAGKQFLGALEDLVEKFEEDYVKDGNAKDALLDEVIDYLTKLKGK